MREERILIVDDDKSIRELARKILTREEFDIQTANNGSEAVTLLRKSRFDLVITDLSMPIMSGEDLLTVIKADYPDTEVIVITTYPTIDTAVNTLKLGAYDYIIKPLNFELMLAVINRVIERKKLFKELKNEKLLREKTISLFEDVYDLFLSTIKSIADTIEAKDTYTLGHCERIREYSLQVGRNLNLTTDEMRDLEYAALLHDVGKIAIPETILNKPSKLLTADEFEVLKTHTIKGANILSHIKQLKSALLGIKYHHERFDGKGYPERIKGKDIPLIARIITVADAYDAMTSDRVYRKSLPLQTAKDILTQERNKQFDGEIVDVFLGVIG